MEAFFAELQSLSARVSDYLNNRQNDSNIQNHLKWVYLTLCGALAAAAVGVYLNIFMDIDGFLTFPVFLASIMLLFSTPQYKEMKRFCFLIVAAFLEGASVGSLIHLAVKFDSRILVAALLSTAVSWGCFSAASIVTRGMESFWVGGQVTSGFSIFIWLHSLHYRLRHHILDL